MSRGRLYSFQSAFVRLVIWTGTCGFGRRRGEVLAQLRGGAMREVSCRRAPVGRAAKGRAKAPPEFRFCVKAPQFLPHEARSPTSRRSGRVIPDSEKPAYGSFRDT